MSLRYTVVDDQETREPTRMLQAETVGESQADADASAPRIPSAVAPLLVQITPQCYILGQWLPKTAAFDAVFDPRCTA
jgi:hypothetical protein